MGQQNSSITHQLKSTCWKVNSTFKKNITKPHNIKNLCQVTKYIPLSQLRHQKQIYNLRLFNKQFIVSPEGFQINSHQNFICSQQNCKITYYFYQTKKCLFDLHQLSVTQGLALLTHCFKGFIILLKVFGYFVPQAEMIVEQNGKWKVWISSKFTQIKNQHKLPNNLNYQLIFAKKLIKLFDVLRDSQNPSFSYTDFIFENQKNLNIDCFEDIMKILTHENPNHQTQKSILKKQNLLKNHSKKKSLSFISSKSLKYSQMKKTNGSSLSTPFANVEQKIKNIELQQTKESFGNFKNSIRKQESQYLIDGDQQIQKLREESFQSMNEMRTLQKSKHLRNFEQQMKPIQKTQILMKDKITQRSEMVPQSQIQIQLPKQSEDKIKQQVYFKQVGNILNHSETYHIKNQSGILNHKRISKLSYDEKNSLQEIKRKSHKRSLTDKTQQSKGKFQKKRVKICCSQEIFSDILINKNNQNGLFQQYYDEQNKKQNGFSDVLETCQQFQTNQKQTQFAIKIKTSQNFRKTLNNTGKTVKSIKILDTDVNIDDQIMKDLNYIINNGFIRRGNKTLSINAAIIQMQSSLT